MRRLLLDKFFLMTILSLILLTVTLNSLIFSNQLNYGFGDVDWMSLYFFKLYGNFSLDNILHIFNHFGAYTFEAYYVGILEKFIGINYSELYQVSHFFKIISALLLYFFVFKMFKRRILAMFTSLIYTISYTHAGPFLILATSAYFFAGLFMLSFIVSYYNTFIYRKPLKWEIFSALLLFVTLILSPERMYSLLALIPIVEIFYLKINNWKKDSITTSLKRSFIIFLPVALFALCYFVIFKNLVTVKEGFAPNQILIGTQARVSSVVEGNWQLLIYPFASFGSIFLHGEYWKWFGTLNFQTFGGFVFSLIFGPIIKLGALTFFGLWILQKKALKLTFIVLCLVFAFGLVVYGLNIYWQGIDLGVRIHFDPDFTALPAIFGFYIFILTLIFFRLIPNPAVLGSLFAFLFILTTWVVSDVLLLFMGPHRYLSIPSMGTSLFIAAILVACFDKLKTLKTTKHIAVFIFLLIVPLIIVNHKIANDFINYELEYAGMRGSDQSRMQTKFRSLIQDVSKVERSLFYFDETTDKPNNYFDESTILAGFEYWTRVNLDGSLNQYTDPAMVRTSLHCIEHTHDSCIKMLKEKLIHQDGEKGFLYEDFIRPKLGMQFYKINNFYAFRFINKDIVDVTDEVLEEINNTNR